MKSHLLFSVMPHQLATEVLEDIYLIDKAIYRGVLDAVAQARKVRVVYLERQPRPQRHAAIVSVLSRTTSDAIADNLLRTWLLKKHTALLGDFLDALKIQHEDGVVEDLPQTVAEDQLKAAVETLLSKHRGEIVALYLHAFSDMNDVHWENLQQLLEEDPRLHLAKAA